jgi:hypothetical protein
MKQLREEVLAALREAEQLAASAASGTIEHDRAVDAVVRLRALHDDIEMAMRLGITDRGEFATLFDEARFEPRGAAEAKFEPRRAEAS